MLMHCQENRWGHWEIDPVSSSALNKLVALMPEPPARKRGSQELAESLIYLQSEQEISDWMAEFSPRVQRALRDNKSWTITVRMDDEHIESMLGIG